MSASSLKSLLRTAKQRQLQERQSPYGAGSHAFNSPPLTQAPQPPSKHADRTASASFLSLGLSQPLPPPRRLTAEHLVRSGLPTCYYISEWCSREAEADMLRCCDACPVEHWVQLRGRSLQCWGNTPRAAGAQLPYAAHSAVSSAMPAWLAPVMRRVERSGLFADATHSSDTDSPTSPPLPAYPSPDHVLINKYEASQGITAHKDGPAYHPLVAILSLASHTVMHFYAQPPASAVYSGEEKGQPLLSLLLEPRSLLVFTDELYTQLYHCIHEQSEDSVDPRDIHNWQQLSSEQKGCVHSADAPVQLKRSTRYSLTIRASKEHG